MPRFLFRVAWIPVALALVVPAAAQDTDPVPTLRLPESLPPVAESIVAADAEYRHLHRVRDLEGIGRLQGRLLAEHADEDWALELTARALTRVHGIVEAQRICDERDAEALGAGLGEDAWDLLRGIISHRRGRSATAHAVLEDVAARRPDWAIAHAYMFQTGLNLLHPLEELQAHVDACADDGPATEIIVWNLDWISYVNPEHPVGDRLAALLADAPPTRLRTLTAAAPELRRRMKAAMGDAEAMLQVWRDFADRFGEDVWHFAGDAAYLMATRLEGDAAMEALATLEVGDPRSDAFRRRRAEEAMGLDRTRTAWELAADLDDHDTSASVLKLKLMDVLADGPSTTARADHLFQCDTWNYVLREMRTQLSTADRNDDWLACWNEVTVENPRSAMLHRLRHLGMGQDEMVTALLDSLAALDLYADPFADERRSIGAIIGAIPVLDEVLAEPDPYERMLALSRGMNAAEHKGNHQAALEFARALLPMGAGRPSLLVSLMQTAADLEDPELAREAQEMLVADYGGDPYTVRRQVRQTFRDEGPAAARAMVAAIDPEDPAWSEPLHLGDLAMLAAAVELDDLADRASARGVELYPQSGPLAMTRADILKRQGDHAGAEAIYRRLMEEYPGSASIASELMALGDAVVTLADNPDVPWDDREVFAPFGHELEDPDWVRALKLSDAEVDSLQDDAVTLYESDSVVLVGVSGSYQRTRRVYQITSEAGAEMHRTKILSFNPEHGVPRLRVARVLTPNGGIHDIDPKDVLIRAPEGGDADVSDQREMVITLGNLTPGALVDIVSEEYEEVTLVGGYAVSHGFYSSIPVRESVYEVLAPQQLELLSVVHGEGIEVENTGRPDLFRWRYRDLEPVEEEDWQPDWSLRLPWVGLTTYADWDEVGRSYGDPYWDHVVVDEQVTELAERLTENLDDDEDKAEALYRYVIEEINGLAVELGSGRLLPSLPQEVLDRGWGDCKDSSTLLIALLEAVGIEARPVLVSTWGSTTPREDFPCLMVFNHMIVQITGLRGDPYCDPLNGTNCLAPVPSASTGRLALHIGREGDHELKTMPAASSDENGFELEVDVTPLDTRSLRWDLSARYTGEPARYMGSLLAFADTTFQKQVLDSSVGYGVRTGVQIGTWSFTESDCGEITARVTYVDTVWADEGATEAMLRHVNEAPNYWGLPDDDERVNDVVFRSPYNAHVVLRLRGTSAWTPSDQIAEFETEGPHHRGRIEVDSGKEDGHPMVTVTADFELRDRGMSLAEFQDFHREVTGFYTHAAQVFRFRHPLDGDRVQMITQYVEEFPDDMGFRLKAAMDLLGNNFGGHGEDGSERRRLARDLLAPLVAVEAPGMLPSVIAATVESMDGRYRVADELMDKGRRANPNDLQVALMSLALKREMEDYDAVIELSEIIVNQTGNPEAIGGLVMAQMVMENEEEVSRQLRRLEMMGAPMDSLNLLSLRFTAADLAKRSDEMAELLPLIRERLPEEDMFRTFEASYYTASEDFVAAAEVLGDIVGDDPTDAGMCNNLAWALALSGQDLERAHMLAKAATIMSTDPVRSRNTYGAVVARMGEWSEARDIFRSIFERDQRPSSRMVNGYFWGLAEWELGNEDKAEEVWGRLADIPDTFTSLEWRAKLDESRRLIAAGEDPAAAVFLP